MAAFKKNLIDLTDFEIKHAKVKFEYTKDYSQIFDLLFYKSLLLQAHAEMLKKCLAALQNE